MNDISHIAVQNQRRAWEIIDKLDIFHVWEAVGAEAHLVGSLKMGLLMKRLDIDFHIYSEPLNLADSFAAIAKLAGNAAIKRIEYANLIDTDEKCIEWHAWYLDKDNELWQIDMIHIVKNSFYDGYFENVAERIESVLTPESRKAILEIKNDTPDSEKIMGIEIYQAVIENKISNYTDFMEWKKKHPLTGINHWIP